jgi:hypothetical protein
MNFLARLLGNYGTVRFKGITMDGRFFDGKVKIETIGLSIEEIEAKLKNVFFVEKGIHAKELKIIGYARNA